MKRQLTLFLLLIIVSGAAAQSVPCWFDSLKMKCFDSTSKLKKDENLFYYRLNKWRENNTLNLDNKPTSPSCNNCLIADPSGFRTKYIIPVVVHIVHRPSDPSPGDSSNITDGQVENQIKYLNHYFAGLDNNDPRSVNTGIQFCLAQIGPGNKGIFRVSSSLSNHNPAIQNMKQLMDLKPDSLAYQDYLHIYVVNGLIDGSGNVSGIQGYATFPGAEPQGIVISHRKFGNTAFCTGCNLDGNSYGKILVHEVGHFLGLQHTFEGGCAGITGSTCADSGDYCCDTPPLPSENTGCSPTPVNSCINGVNAMIENYMDYTNDACRSIFTLNQTEIMHFTLLTLRSQLVNPLHINKVPLACESFSARFSGTNTVMCEVIDSVRFTALKYANINPVYYWEIKKGNILVHSDSTNSYQYSWLPPSTYDKYKVILRLRVDMDMIADSLDDFIQVIDCGGPIRSSQGTWYFGQYAGLKFMKKLVVADFNAYDPPSTDPRTINTSEGCISICDTFGRLLFYGGAGAHKQNDQDNLLELFNHNHNKVVTDKFGAPLNLYSHGSCTQSAVAFPNPADTSQYYLITNQTAYEHAMRNGLSVFMIEKDNSNNITVIADIDTINIVSGEGLLAVPGCNNNWWLLFNTSDRRIAVYEFNDSGKHFRYVTGQYALNEQGYIKSSPDGRFVGKDGQLFKFNTQTGQLSNWLNFSDTFYLGTSPYMYQIYGSSFSPNSEVYYYIEANEIDNGRLWQLDLSIADPIANRQMITEFPHDFLKTMQLGPDNKIYISKEGDTRLAVIENPDNVCSPGNSNACNFTLNGPFVQIGGIGGVVQIGLPNMIDTKIPESIKKDIKFVQQDCDSVTLSSSVCCSEIYEWDFGDMSPKVYQKETGHRYLDTGTYIVTLKIDSLYTITRQVNVGIEPNGILGKKDICDTINGITYSADKTIVHSYQYNWESNNGTVVSVPRTPNYASVKWRGNGHLKLSITDIKTGCQSSDSINVIVRPPVTNNYIYSHPYQNPCKVNLDSISGSIPSQTSPWFKYGWLIEEFGKSPRIIAGEHKKYLVPEPGTNAYFKRVIWDSGCYHESNKVKIVNIKNEIGGQIGKCGGLISGSNMSWYDGTLIYKWYTSIDSFLTDSSLISGNSYDHEFDNTPVWTRRVAYNGACTTVSNILNTKTNIEYEKDLPEFKYICGNGNLALDIKFEFKSGINFLNPYNYLKYYKISSSTGDTTVLPGRINSTDFIDGDTVYAVHYVNTCGLFYSRKCIIRKSYNYINFTTHPLSETKAAGTSKVFYAVLSNSTGVRWNWQVSGDNANWYNIDSAPNNDTFVLANLNRCQNGRYYRVQAITGCGITNSNSALLTITGLGSYTQDYWMKDHWRDTGKERNPDSAYIVESVDLWVRNKPDGIKPVNLKDNQMVAEGDNYIYYTIRNRGVDTAKNGRLYLYWTWAGTGEEWPRKWKYGPDNMYPSPNTGVYHPMGSEINLIPIDLPDIKSGDSVNGYIKWDYNVPKPTWFIKDDNLSDLIWPTANICLLSRIQTCNEPEFGMTFKESKNLNYNAIGNNNIATRNSWMRFINPPGNMDYVKKMADGNQVTDIGTTVVGSIHNTPTKYRLCIDMINTSYLSKANLYLEMSTEFEDAWIAGGSVASGLTFIQDNIYKVISSSVCLDSLMFNSKGEGTVRLYSGYINPDDKFADGEIYPISIIQYQYNDILKIGEVRIDVTDNPMPDPIINSESSLTACQWDMGTTPSAKYIHTNILPYTIWDTSNSNWISSQTSGIYYLEPAVYIITSTDSTDNTIYRHTLTVESVSVNTVNRIDTVWYNCDNPDEVTYFAYCENGVMYDMLNQVVEESEPDQYLLNPQETTYTFICDDSSSCVRHVRTIVFKDILVVPLSTSNYLTGMYNRQEHPCCFIDLTEAECDGETPLTFGQEVQVYDMNADFLYQTNLELYGGTVLGFRFCPPQWDTNSNVISNWYSIVIRNDECSFCRMDFMCDSLADPEPFIILNYPSGYSNVNQENSYQKSKSGGIAIPVEKPGKLPTSISIYPNPTSSEVNVKVISPNSEFLTVQIKDATGKFIYSGNYETSNNSMNEKIDLTSFTSGVYTVYIPELGYYYKLVIIR